MPIRSTGNEFVTNSFSQITASQIIFLMVEFDGLFRSILKSRQAKSQCIPSSLDMSSLEKHNPGISPLFFNQNMEQKDPEKKIPSTAAKATNLSPKEFSEEIHLNAHSDFFLDTWNRFDRIK